VRTRRSFKRYRMASSLCWCMGALMLLGLAAHNVRVAIYGGVGLFVAIGARHYLAAATSRMHDHEHMVNIGRGVVREGLTEAQRDELARIVPRYRRR
jgi:hypothetical protein